jgi:membrane protein implicated in regulation of membrane protease activity
MDDETQVRTGNRQLKEIASTLRGDIAGFALDVRTLSELQFKLFVMEAQEHGRRAVLPTIVLLFAATLGGACFPIAFVAIAFLIVQTLELSYAFAFSITAIAGAILSLLLGATGWMLLRSRVSMPNRSRQELSKNLRWMKRQFKVAELGKDSAHTTDCYHQKRSTYER